MRFDRSECCVAGSYSYRLGSGVDVLPLLTEDLGDLSVLDIGVLALHSFTVISHEEEEGSLTALGSVGVFLLLGALGVLLSGLLAA